MILHRAGARFRLPPSQFVLTLIEGSTVRGSVGNVPGFFYGSESAKGRLLALQPIAG